MDARIEIRPQRPQRGREAARVLPLAVDLLPEASRFFDLAHRFCIFIPPFGQPPAQIFSGVRVCVRLAWSFPEASRAHPDRQTSCGLIETAENLPWLWCREPLQRSVEPKTCRMLNTAKDPVPSQCWSVLRNFWTPTPTAPICVNPVW